MWSERRVFWLSVTVRFFCLVLTQTHYVPDEYWQSLEPAHRLAFGYGYLTWEWRRGLRSYIIPCILAAVYKFLSLLHLDAPCVVVMVPRMMQTVLTAIGDVYLYKFAKLLYGQQVAAWTWLAFVGNWFVAYTASRTLANATEATLLICGLYLYAWPVDYLHDGRGRKFPSWQYLTLAGMSLFIRPTSAVMWIPMVLWHLFRVRKRCSFIFRTCLPIGIPLLSCCVYVDRICYDQWTLSLWNFAMFNVFQGGSAHFGSHSWHWYASQGLPVVIFVWLLPVIGGFSRLKHNYPWLLTGLFVFIHSCLPHKEFRFLLPCIPLVSLYAGFYFTSASKLVGKNKSELYQKQTNASWDQYWNLVPLHVKLQYLVLLMANLVCFLYCGLLHQRGPIDVMKHLSTQIGNSPRNFSDQGILYLLPCHSTPFYSHLHWNVPMRFLECEPNFHNRSDYVDEADIFHLDPKAWIQYNLVNLTTNQGNPMGKPRYIVMYSWLRESLGGGKYLQAEFGYKHCQRIFHSWIFEKPRQSQYFDLMCAAW